MVCTLTAGDSCFHAAMCCPYRYLHSRKAVWALILQLTSDWQQLHLAAVSAGPGSAAQQRVGHDGFSHFGGRQEGRLSGAVTAGVPGFRHAAVDCTASPQPQVLPQSMPAMQCSCSVQGSVRPTTWPHALRAPWLFSLLIVRTRLAWAWFNAACVLCPVCGAAHGCPCRIITAVASADAFALLSLERGVCAGRPARRSSAQSCPTHLAMASSSALWTLCGSVLRCVVMHSRKVVCCMVR